MKDSASSPRRIPGRPMSQELSDQLCETALDILAASGWRGFNADRIARRASAGKAAIYRRWTSMVVLAAEAVERTTLFAEPKDHGSLRADLESLLEHWARPLTRDERATAALTGVAQHHPEIRDALERSFTKPLKTAIDSIALRYAERDGAAVSAQADLLHHVVEALAWRRLICGSASDDVRRLVDEILLPLVEGRSRTEVTSEDR
ncbi:TetR/AcrR family transcriptional regulator [Blastococcus sp. TF02A-26]|uniref:TetR/AcrR family transcriptional regulator n=1 Tax=Blastococcus sp. TF02A-26 TaxID=2250577 RepID=UPI0013148B85|nr:TetR/AcrR family transcriptional regulator [Blastococcus sp. TF02A-26]